MASAKHDPEDGNIAQLNFFAALPGRVTSDTRLTALHFRVLARIAGFDRMGRNGQCCWAGSKMLSQMVGCAEGSFRNAVSELVTLGYLKVERSPSDGRRVGYAVIYDSKRDAAGIGAKAGTNIRENMSSTDDTSRRRNMSSFDDRSGRKTSSSDDRKSRDMSSDNDGFSPKKSRKIKVDQIIRASIHKRNILSEALEYKWNATEKLAFAERNFGSGRVIWAPAEIEHIPDETWATIARLAQAGTLTEVQLEIAVAEGRQALALKAAGVEVANG